MTDTEPRATPADIAEMTRYATESRPPAVDIPAEAVEAGARGLCAHDATEVWDDGGLPDTAREAYRDMSRAVLAAAAPLLIQAGREQATAGGGVALRGEVEALYRAAYQAGREAAAQALLACYICDQIHPERTDRDGRITYAAMDGHAYHPAYIEADTAARFAEIARGRQDGDTDG